MSQLFELYERSLDSWGDGADQFNKEIGAWYTSAVTDMAYMFHGASTFN